MLEDAAVLRLMTLHKGRGGPLELVDFYNGELASKTAMQELIVRLMGASPAILVATGETQFEPTDLRKRRYKERLSLYVLVVSRHLRSPEHRNRKDLEATINPSADPGVYALMRAAKDLLVGWDMAVAGLEPLSIVQEDVIFQQPELTMWRLLFRGIYAETRPRPELSFPSAVPVETFSIRHDHVDQDGDGVGFDGVVVTDIP